MSKSIDEKLKNLLSERETTLAEMNELEKAYNIRQKRIIEISGAIKVIQELINEDTKIDATKSDKK
ncbi:MAG: hypothetical protein SPJ27_01115 [Candidatus Onthovivens sp.]|nr:hypothetical protein [Candidatus Onthovivens sp.]